MDCVDCVTSKCSDLLDIVIVSSRASEAASLWVNYLTTCFQQVAKERSRPPFKLLSVKVEDVLSGVTVLTQQDAVFKARLQVVILCPVFLECVSARLSPATSLSSLLQPGHVLAMLLGVTDEAITLQHRAVLVCYEKWQRQIVKDQDPMFVGDFLGTAMDILSRSWQLQQAINQIHKDEDKAQFSVIPKKIKVGQNKLMILLTDSLEATDTVDISIDKNGEKIEVPSFKKRNPYTLQFVVPASCMKVSMLVTVAVKKNGKPLGYRLIKCESRMRELDQLLRSTDNPLQFMCQTLGLSPSDREELDVFLSAAFQQNLPPHFHILRPTGIRHHSSSEEYPTLLHFAARYGLEKLSWQLLECPGGEQASQMRNSCQLTPADMAERAGHSRLANTLKGFLQMTELSSMYSYLKGMSEKQENDLVMNFNCTNYLLPRPLNKTYSVPPAARPVISTPPPNTSSSNSPHPLHQYTNINSYQVPPLPLSVADNFDYNVPSFPLPFHSPMENYQVPGQAIPYNPPTTPTPSSPLDTISPCGYMDMHSTSTLNGVSSANKLRRKMVLNLPHHEYHNCPTESQDSFFNSEDDIFSCQQSYTSQGNSSHSSNSGKSSIVSAQDELAEIINDFKNDVFTITEVEKLVESWQNRHDVQQSFKDKQIQLNEMREEYEKIQKTMKVKLKRPTPFERIRKFFSRGKNKNCSGVCKNKLKMTTNGTCTAVNRRPPSSLSLHSSCSSTSSGRMSTGSGTSLGDSGTHSDTEDKRNSETNKNEILKMAHGKLYSEISQRGPTSLEDNQETLKIGESYSLISGTAKPILTFRTNSLIKENTIEEEVEENQKNSITLLDTPKYCLVEGKIETEGSTHNDENDTNLDQTKCKAEEEQQQISDQSNKLPLPPSSINIRGSEETYCGAQSSKEFFKTPEQLVILEEGDNHLLPKSPDILLVKEDLPDIGQQANTTSQHDLDFENTCSNESTISEYTRGFVKNIVNIIENEHSLNNSYDEAEEVCDHILEEAETEMVFDLPDYVNVTMSPIPPQSTMDEITTQAQIA